MWGLLQKRCTRLLITELDKLKERLRMEWVNWIMSSLRQPFFSRVVNKKKVKVPIFVVIERRGPELIPDSKQSACR